MGFEVGGLVGLLLLVADIWAIVNTLASRASLFVRLLWIVIIMVLPVLGLLLWLMLGPRAARFSHHDP